MFGGTGEDTIRGGGGADRLEGGADADTFIFTSVDNAINLVTDFTVGVDVIELSGVTEIVDYADLIANHVTDFVGFMDIASGTTTIRLNGVQIADLSLGDFSF